MGDEEWYYVNLQNEQTGPCTVVELGKLYAGHVLTDETYVWNEQKTTAWEPLNTQHQLFAQVKDLASPPAPPARTVPPLPSTSNLPPSACTVEPAEPAEIRNAAALLKAENWQQKKTADGTDYYWNTVTESVTWDKPDVLCTAEERDTASGDWVWVKDESEGWEPGRLIKTVGDSVTVQLRSGRKKAAKKTKEPLWPLKLSSLRQIEEDLVMVDDINTALMMHCLKERYKRDQIYTWVGANHSVLVSINPFKQLPIYSASTIEEYSRPSAYREDKPHTFAIANSAFTRLSLESTCQAILISGESGAGKTECLKQCFSFLADVAGSSGAVEQRILHANPVLEAFGNAKTVRNNNSSRFGRWTEVHFDSRNRICGARVENYLLEKQRVVSQAPGERNYHIFYQLCHSEVGQLLNLGDVSGFRYLNGSGCLTVSGVNDAKDFLDVESSLDKLGLSLEEKCYLYETCAGVLYLGNIAFIASGEGSALDPNAQASKAADALAKAAYDHMFDYLVGRINLAVQVLDIFGFEIFEKNHFEQLCINYTNEKLQQHFNKHTFQEEESVYKDEQIVFKHVEFIDNQPVVDVIEKKPYGIMLLLDEEVRIPRGTDEAWAGKCKEHNKGNACLPQAGSSARCFVLKHYAGSVTYDVTGFVDTNKDSLHRDLYDAMSASHAPITQALFPPKDSQPRRVTTLGEKFRKALGELMELVHHCEPWYIRCIKANDRKAANTFMDTMYVQIGTTMVMYRAEEHRVLELLRNLCLERVIPVAQRAGRKKIGRHFRGCARQANTICAQALAHGEQNADSKTLEDAIARADAILSPTKACFGWEPYALDRCRKLLFAMRERLEISSLLASLIKLDPLSCYDQLRLAIQRCNTIRDIPCTVEQKGLEDTARQLLHRAAADKIDPLAAEALLLLEKTMLIDIREEAEQIEYMSPQVEDIKAMLLLPEEEFVKRQLEVAKELNDPERVINREIKLRQMYIEANASLFAFKLLPRLRNPEEWAALKPLKTRAFGKKKQQELVATFLRWTTEPIHKSLLDIKGLKGEAIKQFKNLLGYCGDRRYQYPDSFIREIVLKGLEVEALRGELYAQVMKQLNGNSSEQSRNRAWEVLMLMLGCFPPPDDMLNFVLVFVEDNAAADQREKLKLAVHMSHYDGIKECPSLSDIPGVLASFFEREIAQRYNVDEDVVSESVKFAAKRPTRAGWGAATAAAVTVPTDNGLTGGSGQSMDHQIPAMPSHAPPPVPPKPPANPTAQALYDYNPEGQEAQLPLSTGQIVNILDSSGDDWWMASVDGTEGWVPAAYVSFCD
ncbi:unnamed protein product [Chrysoparadoxa australica]